MNSTLSSKDQIKVLESIRWDLMIATSGGLCYAIGLSIYGNCPQHSDYDFISEAIPLFRRSNAQNFGGHPYDDYWWKRDEKGYESRRQFVNWMIDELNKQL